MLLLALQDYTLTFLNLTAYHCLRAGCRRAQGISLAQAQLDPEVWGHDYAETYPLERNQKAKNAASCTQRQVSQKTIIQNWQEGKKILAKGRVPSF